MKSRANAVPEISIIARLGATLLSPLRTEHPEFIEYFYNREPDIRPEGWTFLVYDITGDHEAYRVLADFHDKMANSAAAARWRDRIREE